MNQQQSSHPPYNGEQAPLLEMQLRGLRLSTMLANYRRLLGEHTAPLPYLSDLIALETTKRQENGVRSRIAAAHFPMLATEKNRVNLTASQR
jgi:hypothetical protein